MFILEDRRKKRVAQFAEEPAVMWHLLAGVQAHAYPMWHLLDDASTTWFSSDRMDELIADLEKLKTPEEIRARQRRWVQTLRDGIARIESESEPKQIARSTRRSGPVPSRETLEWMRESVRRAETAPFEFPESLSAEAATIQINAILSLARRCRQIKGFLGHDPFVEAE